MAGAPPSSIPPRRAQFVLAGPSATLDPRFHAVRPDLADVRLAERVFAAHYAAPVTVWVARAASLRASTDPASPVVAELAPGDPFELLERAGGRAWGVAPNREAGGPGLVGYLDEDAL